MKKSVKNVIMIGMTAVLIGTSAITISYAKQDRGFRPDSGMPQMQQFDNQQSQNPFGGFKQDNNNQNGNNSQKPQMPDNQQGDNSQQPQPPSNQQGDSSQQPPSNQQGDSTQQQPPSNQKNNSSQQAQTPDKQESSNDNSTNEKSASDTSLSLVSTSSNNTDIQLSDTQSTAQKGFPENGFKSRNFGVISVLCYVFAGVQILIILLSIIYLIISRFNKKSYNEVIANMRNNQ